MLNIEIYLALFFESIAIFMTVFFFIQYSIIKKKEHLYYALYLMALACYYILAVPELFFPVNNENQKFITSLDIFKRPTQFLSSVFYTFFISYYLGLKSKSAHLYRFFRVLIMLYVLLAAVCLVLNFLKISYDKIYYLISLLLFPVQFYVVIALLKHRVPYSKFVIWGTIIILLGSIIALLTSIYNSNHPSDSLLRHVEVFLPAQVCLLIDMFLFSIALQKKIADNEKSLINASYQRQHAVLLERERIIADLHDDVGGGLSSIRMMSDLLTQQGNTENTASFAHKISLTAKDIAQRMHTIIWSLNADNDTLENFVEYVRQYGISYFENSGISFQCCSESSLPGNLQLKGVLRKNLFLIVKESFHNILKHSGAKHAGINISVLTEALFLEIKDDGSGIRNPNQFGNGLKNMKKRMDEINGNFRVTSDGGTTINIDVKVE